MKQPRLRAVKDWGTEPLSVDDCSSMINAFVAGFNQEAGNQVRMINTGRVERTWKIYNFLNTFFLALFQAVNQFRKNIHYIQPSTKNLDISFTPVEEPSDGLISSFAITEFPGVGGMDEISKLRSTKFDSFIYGGTDDVPYTARFQFI